MIEQLRMALSSNPWLAAGLARLPTDPDAISVLFPAAGRHCGRQALATVPGWRADDAARALLLTALPTRGEVLAEQVRDLYRYGDADEKRGVLRALAFLDVGEHCVDLLADALRTNDTRLVAAALGPYAAHLDPPAWRQGVLKCVFMGIELSAVDGLDARADAELAQMLAGLTDERHAAGRDLPEDATALLHRLTT